MTQIPVPTAIEDLVRDSFVPPERIQQLRQYDRRIFDLDAEIVRKLAKLDGIMQRCNVTRCLTLCEY